MNFKFNCELTDNIFDEISSTPIEYENLDNFSGFSIEIENDCLTMNFASNVSNIELESITNFINKFKNNENDFITFNRNAGSSISIENNLIFFNVYTWKEGTITDLTIKVELNETNREKLNEIFIQLLRFKSKFDSLPINDDDCSYVDENEQNDESDSNNDNHNDCDNDDNENSNQEIDL